METEFYDPDVTFADPLISIRGVEAYRANVGMLSGANLMGRLLFTDCSLVMHGTSAPSERALETRWTLQLRLKLLPWDHLAQFTGVSRYTLDAEARVVSQQDFWDSINLQPDGTYARMPKLAALADFSAQLAPRPPRAAEPPYKLLRRAARYEVRRYPGGVGEEAPDPSLSGAVGAARVLRDAGVVAALRFAAPSNAEAVAAASAHAAALRALCAADGLVSEPTDDFGLSQFDGHFEVWLPLRQHPWQQ